MNKEWHNPDPTTLGNIESEFLSDSGRNKAVIIKTPTGLLMVHGYILDDTDLNEGLSDSIGWISESGPSFTETISDAEAIAKEYLNREK